MRHTKYVLPGLLLISSLAWSACVLQDDGGLLNSFQTSREQLSNAVQVSMEQNAGFRANLIQAIGDSLGDLDQTAGLAGIRSLSELTQNKLLLLEKHESELKRMGMYNPETGKLDKLSESRSSVAYWLDEGNAADLRQALEVYAQQLSKISVRYIDQSQDGTGRNSRFFESGDPESWARNHFSGPLISQLSVLEGLKLQVLQKEWDLLNQFNQLLGVVSFRPNTVLFMDNPVSRTVVAGGVYSTQLSLGMTSNVISPAFSSPSGSLVRGDQPATVFLNIPASGGVIPKGEREGVQSYTANARMRLPNGSYQDIATEGQFIVRKPEIVMRSEALQILYLNCGNDFYIEVPALGDTYNPIITASSAVVIPSKISAHKFRIVPSGKTCHISVSSNSNGQTIKIGDVDFKVVRPPKPTIELAINGKTTGGATPVSKNSRVQVRLVPDADFKANLPEEARYLISSIDILAQLSLGPPSKVNSVNTQGKDATQAINVSLGTQVRQAQPGTKVYLRINDIYRRNFQNQRIKENFSEVERMLSMVVK